VSPDAPADGGPAARLPPLRDIIARHELSARRSLGQNFLLDLNITRRIARGAGPLTGTIAVEIGPGPGGLTRALLETDARAVIAIERDPRCVAALQSLRDAYPGRLIVIEADALDCDPVTAGGLTGPRAIVANLPYNIGTRLLLNWLHRLEGIASMTLMFQKEVADRLTAAPGSPAYGRLSVITQWLCEARPLFDIPPRAFVPAPRVTSTVVRLAPREKPLAPASMADLEAITAAAFGQRRKMLRSALRSLKTDPIPLLETAGVRPDVRAETLSIAEFCALARAFGGCPEGVPQ
jgi:16S rRNA (adenine1518-N6/adenine1519-N6)-dimethyltransferase